MKRSFTISRLTCYLRGQPRFTLIMKINFGEKSPVEEIRNRFDRDVERFSNLETGQTAVMDAPFMMELITQAAVRSTPVIRRVLDIGCGAGNNTLKLLQSAPAFDCDLVDLSGPMLERAYERISRVSSRRVRMIQGDFRSVDLPEDAYDVILAAAVLHHLRDDRDWEDAFHKMYRLTSPGGSVWITDLVSHESIAVHEMMWELYAGYLRSIGGDEYRDSVFEFIEREDTPRPVTYQLDLLRKVGFSQVELLHKNPCFAAFGAMKSP